MSIAKISFAPRPFLRFGVQKPGVAVSDAKIERARHLHRGGTACFESETEMTANQDTEPTQYGSQAERSRDQTPERRRVGGREHPNLERRGSQPHPVFAAARQPTTRKR